MAVRKPREPYFKHSFNKGLSMTKLITSCASTSTAPDGFVQMSFDINEHGEPGNIKVLISEPDNRYDERAIETLSKWKYNPKMVDGVATYQKDLTVQLDFREDK